MMPTSESALASKAKAIFNWHRRNTHCAKCGGPSARNSTASCRTCSKCEEVWYPSLSPVGIVLVADSLKTKLLLVRQGRHPKGMYSCIAGYVDSGNHIEILPNSALKLNKYVDIQEKHWRKVFVEK
jgi:NAD+ diphosphatase